MSFIQFECPHCGVIIEGDDSLYGQRVECRKCHVTILAPPAPAGREPQTARLLRPAATGTPGSADPANVETEILHLAPVARAYPGQLLLGVVLIGLGVGLTLRAPALSWPPWVGLAPLVPGVFLLLLVWARLKSYSYRLTTQRLFACRGWLARQVNELELYRVKDVVVNQGMLERLLGYGTITVSADDDTTPTVDLVGVARPTAVKELIRTHYRAARQREGVRPTEFLQSP